MTEKIIIAAAISILTFLALAAILVVDSTDDVCRPIGLLLLCLVGASIILAKVEPRGRSLCYVTVVLFYIHSVVQALFFGENKASTLSVFLGLGGLWGGFIGRICKIRLRPKNLLGHSFIRPHGLSLGVLSSWLLLVLLS